MADNYFLLLRTALKEERMYLNTFIGEYYERSKTHKAETQKAKRYIRLNNGRNGYQNNTF
jgi:hypothetical protein